MAFNEDSRVKIPAILHLTQLGYSYLSLKGAEWDEAKALRKMRHPTRIRKLEGFIELPGA